MPASTDPVRLQVLVREEARNPEGIAAVAATLTALGFEVTGTGRASLSARGPSEIFNAVFGEENKDEHEPRQLRVPAPLFDRVASVTLAPRHRHLSRRSK